MDAERFCEPLRATEYLRRMVLPSVIKMSGSIEVISEGRVNEPDVVANQLDMVYLDYERPNEARNLRGRIIAMSKVEGNGAWFAVAGGFEAPRDEFDGRREMLQNILWSHKPSAAMVKQQQAADKQNQDLQIKTQAEVQSMIQAIIKNRQDAMERALNR